MERVNIDDLEPRPDRIIKLHPTLKKCVCGMIGTKHKFLKHMNYELEQSRRVGMNVVEFWKLHGEIPLNVEDGDEFSNKKWMEGQHPNYND